MHTTIIANKFKQSSFLQDIPRHSNTRLCEVRGSLNARCSYLVFGHIFAHISRNFPCVDYCAKHRATIIIDALVRQPLPRMRLYVLLDSTPMLTAVFRFAVIWMYTEAATTTTVIRITIIIDSRMTNAVDNAAPGLRLYTYRA